MDRKIIARGFDGNARGPGLWSKRQALPSLMFVCADDPAPGYAASLRISPVQAHVTWLFGDKRDTTRLPSGVEARAAAFLVERGAADAMSALCSSILLSGPAFSTEAIEEDELEVHVVLVPGAASGLMFISRAMEEPWIPGVVREVMAQGPSYVFPLLWALPKFEDVLETLEAATAVVVRVMADLGERFAELYPHEVRSRLFFDRLTPEALFAGCEALPRSAEMCALDLSLFVEARRRRPWPFPMRALARLSLGRLGLPERWEGEE